MERLKTAATKGGSMGLNNQRIPVALWPAFPMIIPARGF